MTKTVFFLALLALAGCGIRSNPETGPVVLSCEGEHVTRGANGDQDNKPLHDFYRIDGVAKTIQRWDEGRQSFGYPSTDLIVSATEARLLYSGAPIAGISSTREFVFDRISGRITDQFLMSNGGSIIFSGKCKAVKSPASEVKF